MTLYEMTKKYSAGKGESMMWKTLAMVSDALEKGMDESALASLMRDVYGVVSNGHYNEEYAREDVSMMYYKDSAGIKHYGPYWTDDEFRSVYEKMKALIPAYNYWDFYVALNMAKADNCRLLDEWFPGISPEDRNKKLAEAAVNFLNDADNPYGDSKIWCYLNPKR